MIWLFAATLLAIILLFLGKAAEVQSGERLVLSQYRSQLDESLEQSADRIKESMYSVLETTNGLGQKVCHRFKQYLIAGLKWMIQKLE